MLFKKRRLVSIFAAAACLVGSAAPASWAATNENATASDAEMQSDVSPGYDEKIYRLLNQADVACYRASVLFGPKGEVVAGIRQTFAGRVGLSSTGQAPIRRGENNTILVYDGNQVVHKETGGSCKAARVPVQRRQA